MTSLKHQNSELGQVDYFKKKKKKKEKIGMAVHTRENENRSVMN